MSDPVVAKIEANPKYHELRRKRNSFGWLLTILMMVVYYGYIALIAFNKPFLAQPIGAGVTSLGIDEIHWGQGKRADQFLTVIYHFALLRQETESSVIQTQ